jgi:hypothetical protein
LLRSASAKSLRSSSARDRKSLVAIESNLLPAEPIGSTSAAPAVTANRFRDETRRPRGSHKMSNVVQPFRVFDNYRSPVEGNRPMPALLAEHGPARIGETRQSAAPNHRPRSPRHRGSGNMAESAAGSEIKLPFRHPRQQASVSAPGHGKVRAVRAQLHRDAHRTTERQSRLILSLQRQARYPRDPRKRRKALPGEGRDRHFPRIRDLERH